MDGNIYLMKQSTTLADLRQRAEALVSQMTIAEKLGQLRNDAPAIERLGIPAYNWWS